ncbi:hypothetical protein O181_033116 [Austropuccinia psidii MF-1]|uniref:Uncharacterized protein n=1 Tax=Austropuccinia psidii MF-1 TaxID=1389203 RepID=A0A9Q3D3S7_9BASI|nr:hypothetical protein [Austropuccinia psidii MF-1]
MLLSSELAQSFEVHFNSNFLHVKDEPSSAFWPSIHQDLGVSLSRTPYLYQAQNLIHRRLSVEIGLGFNAGTAAEYAQSWFTRVPFSGTGSYHHIDTITLAIKLASHISFRLIPVNSNVIPFNNSFRDSPI